MNLNLELLVETSLIEFSSKAFTAGNILDIYVYDVDQLERLDSRMRIKCNGTIPDKIPVSSRSGRKKVVALANWSEEEPSWEQVNSFNAICRWMVPLSTESSEAPRMSGSMIINAGKTTVTKLTLIPISARIRLSSVKCDFTGQPYQGAVIENARVYLTNVCTNSSPFPESVPGTEFVNIDSYSVADMNVFGAKDKLSRYIYTELGPQKVKTDIDFYCYANYGTVDNGGRPPTRLVLEGRIGDKTVYYTVNIGDYTDGAVRPGYSYNINLNITKYGTDRPDIPVTGGTIDATVEVIPWEEKEEQIIDY